MSVDNFKIAKGMENLIYDIMIWVVFYPYTLFRIIFQPLNMINYASIEMNKEYESFSNSINPPIFLFLSIVLSWIIVPIDPNSINELLNKQGENAAILRMASESTTNLITFRVALYCSLPLLGALIYEWRTPGGINQETFRIPVYQQCYITAPFSLLLSAAMTKLSLMHDAEHVEMQVVALLLAVLAMAIWALIAQYKFFRHLAKCGRLSAALFAVAVIPGGMLPMAFIM